jgi:hypothetical protein
MQVMENLDVAKNVDTQHTIDYTNYSLSHPSHAFQKILQQSGGTTRIIGNSLQESLFELPTKVFSLADSILSFDVELRNGGTPLADNLIRRVHSCGMPFIQGIQLYTRSNLRIVDIVDADKYARVMFPRTHKLEDYLENDINVRGVQPTGQSASNGYMFHRSNATVNSQSVAPSAYQSARIIAAGGALSQINYTEPCYFYQGIPELATASANEGRIHLRIQLPLSAYKNTMLDCSKDMWFGGEVLILKIVWNTLDKIGWLGNNGADPAAGAALMSVNTTICEVQNLSLYLKVETNPVIARQLIEKMENGFEMHINYVHTFKFGQFGPGSVGLQQRINRNYGKTLNDVVYATFHATENGISNYDHQQNKLTSYYTSLDHDRLVPFNINIGEGLDYMVNKALLKDSVVQSSDIYNHNWAHVDSWLGLPLDSKDRCKYSSSGLDLSNEHIWSVQAESSAAANHYVFMNVEKILVMKGGEITLI